MSTTHRRAIGGVVASITGRSTLGPLRLGALGGAIGLIVAIVSVLSEAITVTGDPTQLHYVAAGAFVAATLFGRYVREEIALGVGVVAIVVGVGGYLSSTGVGFQPGMLLASSIELATGLSILHIEETTTWALGITPGPVFLTWYFALRRRYALSGSVGAAVVGFFVLTGDAGSVATLLGVVGTAALLGFGDLERDEGTTEMAESLLVVLAILILTPLFISVIPGGGGAAPLSPDFGTDGAEKPIMTGEVVEAGDELEMVGSITLSPEVVFTVEADQGGYWRTGSYDRYTGDGWVKAAEVSGENELRAPDGPTRPVTQTVEIETSAGSMPAAFRPVEFESETIAASDVEAGSALQPERLLEPGESYTVRSSVPNASSEELRSAGTEYPSDLEEAYTQLPSDVPDRVGDRTGEIVADDETVYDSTRTLERYLRENKAYSLDVERPDGDVADAFLFEMDAGYCTYFATTMVTMLRSQEIPARMAVGYSTGQKIDDDTWVVRGTNAHAWVEVYFPGYGWKAFEPTPPQGLIDTQIETLETARGTQEFADVSFDTTRSGDVSPGETTTSIPGESTTEDEADAESRQDFGFSGRLEEVGLENVDEPEPDAVETETEAEADDDDETGAEADVGAPLPGVEVLALGAVVVAGIIAGGHRSRRVRAIFEGIRVRYQPRRDPETDVEVAFERLMFVLQRRHRDRSRGETVNEYLEAIDPDARARRVAAIRERARYRGEVSAAAVDEAVELVDELIRGR